jgi:hypothetical protein
MPDFRGQPGLVTAIGVVSIVVAGFSILASLGTVLQAGGYYMMSVMSTTVGASTARRPPVAPMPAPVVVSPAGRAPAPVTGPGGMEAAERAAAVATLTRLRPMTPMRKRHLDAILAQAGKYMATDKVTQSGTMDEMPSGEQPPDYFVTPTGRLEVFNNRAVFFPTDGTPTVRVTAPPPDPSAPVAASPPVEVQVEPSPDAANAAGGADAPAPQATSAPAAATAPAVPGALTPAEVQSLVHQAQTLSSNGLNAAQVAALQGVLTPPGQQFVQPGSAQGAVASAYARQGSPAYIQFADGSSVTLSPQGVVTARSAAPVMPTFSFNPLNLGLMVATAVASLALAVFLLVCGIITLRQSPRARRWHLIYSFLKLPLAVLAGLSSAWVARDLMAGMAGAGAPVTPTMGFSLFSGIVPIVLGCAYPVALLIVLNLKQVKDYYAYDGERVAGQLVAG